MDIALHPSVSNEWSRVAPSVLTDCRRRLSDSPMSYLFKATLEAWKDKVLGAQSDIGLHVLAVDGTTFRCQDPLKNGVLGLLLTTSLKER